MIRRGFLTLACFVGMTAAAGTRIVEFQTCGVVFTMPASWSARLLPAATIDDSMQCDIALRPRGWSQRAKRSRWGAPDPPLHLVVFKRHTSYDEALDRMGFETDGDANRGLGVRGGRGSFATAESYRAGKSTGVAAYSFFRGFITDEKLLKKDESRVFSGEMGHIVLKTRSGRVIAFESQGKTPDEPLDYEPVIQIIGRSIVIKAPR